MLAEHNDTKVLKASISHPSPAASTQRQLDPSKHVNKVLLQKSNAEPNTELQDNEKKVPLKCDEKLSEREIYLIAGIGVLFFLVIAFISLYCHEKSKNVYTNVERTSFGSSSVSRASSDVNYF